MYRLDVEFVGARYRLESIIGSGGMGTVYRATDRLNGHAVALKRVKTPINELGFASKSDKGGHRLALVKEFSTLSSLRHPYIIDVLDYGFDQNNNPFFTMELLETGIPIRGYAAFASPDKILDRLMEMLQVLIYLHRRGILHRDIKPANIMVTNDHIKILDFGLAKSLQARSSEYSKGQIAGTMAYMAPELFKGAKVTRATDLYAVGLIAYELLTGSFPFEGNNLAHLAYEIMNTTPNMGLLTNVPDEVVDIIDKLLIKDPNYRYQDATEVMRDFRRALRREPAEDVTAIRESFLQAANFVGRDKELQILRNAMEEAIDGNGSAWLVGGESGVGKTRLLDELRIRALVQGVMVLRGQVAAERINIYHSWREIIRHLCLEVELTDLEAQVLRLLVPDIDRLIEREVAEAPSVQPQAALERLLQILESIFRRQTRPMILIMEDLHWAREGLAILQHLVRIVEDLPLLLIASFRNDARPDLPEQIPEVRLMMLERLTLDAIRELSESMIGVAGRQEYVVEMLARETEGNALFIVEVMRTLAEDAGQLEHIGRMTIPDRVFTDGIRTVIARRLSNLPDHAMFPLKIAAVAGRQIELDLLQTTLPDYDWEKWLVICSEAAIISAEGYGWRFSHDKLRESILEVLDKAEQRMLSQRIAESIEQCHSDDTTPYAAILTNHWHYAENSSKELHYAWIAAQQLYAASNIRAMRHYLQRALAIAEQDPASEVLYWKIQVRLVEAHALISDLPAAARMLESIFQHIPQDNPDILCVRCEAYYHYAHLNINRGEYQQARDTALEGLALSEHCPESGPKTRMLWIMGMAELFNGNYEQAIPFYQQSLAAAQATDDMVFIMSAHNGLGSCAFMQDNLEEAIRQTEKSYELSVACGNYLYQSYALHNIGAFYSSYGYAAEALPYLQEAVSLAHRLNILPVLALGEINIGAAQIMLGDFDEGLAMVQKGMELALTVDAVPTILFGIASYAMLLSRHQKHDQAKTLFAYVLGHPKTQVDDLAIFNKMVREIGYSTVEMEAAQSQAQALEFNQIISEILQHSDPIL